MHLTLTFLWFPLQVWAGFCAVLSSPKPDALPLGFLSHDLCTVMEKRKAGSHRASQTGRSGIVVSWTVSSKAVVKVLRTQALRQLCYPKELSRDLPSSSFAINRLTTDRWPEIFLSLCLLLPNYFFRSQRAIAQASGLQTRSLCSTASHLPLFTSRALGFGLLHEEQPREGYRSLTTISPAGALHPCFPQSNRSGVSFLSQMALCRGQRCASCCPTLLFPSFPSVLSLSLCSSPCPGCVLPNKAAFLNNLLALLVNCFEVVCNCIQLTA